MTMEQREVERAMLDPAAVFASPEDLVERPDLTSAQKVAILRRWLQDARAVAGQEGVAEDEPSLVERVSAAASTEQRKLQEEVDGHAGGKPDLYLENARAELNALDTEIAVLQQRREEISSRVKELSEANDAMVDDLRIGLQKATDGVRDALRTTVERWR